MAAQVLRSLRDVIVRGWAFNQEHGQLLRHYLAVSNRRGAPSTMWYARQAVHCLLGSSKGLQSVPYGALKSPEKLLSCKRTARYQPCTTGDLMQKQL